MRVQVIRARPRRHEAIEVVLATGASAAEAIEASGLDMQGVEGLALYGERIAPTHILTEGDRVEMLGPLLVDPKDARRKRAARIRPGA